MTLQLKDDWAFKRYLKIKAGVQTLYEPEKHIPMLLRLFNEAKDIASFCGEAEINRSSFWNWVQANPDFKEAYEHALELGRIRFEEIGMEGIGRPDFNNGLWSIIMKNRFGFTSDRKIKLAKMRACKTALEEHSAIKDEISEGNLTGPEITHLGNFVATGVKVREHTDHDERLTKLEQNR